EGSLRRGARSADRGDGAAREANPERRVRCVAWEHGAPHVRAGVMTGLTLDEIAREIPGGASIAGDARTRVMGVHHDSREVAPGDLFVARKGAQADGARFVADAKARGAAAVLAAKSAAAEIAGEVARAALPLVLVDDLADGLAYASAAV